VARVCRPVARHGFRRTSGVSVFVSWATWDFLVLAWVDRNRWTRFASKDGAIPWLRVGCFHVASWFRPFSHPAQPRYICRKL
jgi:hypothetical protein